MNKVLLLFFIVLSQLGFSQFTDNFSDGDYTLNPIWSPSAPTDFAINTNRLQSNNLVASSTFYISTPSSSASDCQWEFFVNLQFATSGANYVDAYLTADNANLSSVALNGYFVRIGNTLDEICLYKNVAGTPTMIINGVDAIVASGTNNLIKIKVTRTAANNFTLERDMTGTGTAYVSEGSVVDATFTTSGFFGFLVKQSTATFFQKHFFDDIYVGPIVVDVTPPAITSTTVISSTQLDVLFNEAVDPTTAQTASNYTANNALGNPTGAVIDGVDPKLVHLTFATPFTNGLQNTLTVNAVQDLFTNPISNGTSNFMYLFFSTPTYHDIILNEIMVDVNPVPAGVPARQYIELYNKTNNYYNLNNWKFSDAVTTITIANSYTLAPNSYVLIAKSSDTALFVGLSNKIGTGAFPSYNISGDAVVLKDNLGALVDSINYTTTWYNDAIKSSGGWSLELINPNANINCLTQNNWAASTNANGGTPGVQNSIYSTAPDITAPQFVSATIVDSVTLTLCFNEAISSSLISTLSNYTVNNSIGNPSSATPSSNNTCVTLTFATSFISQLANTITFSSLADCSGNLVTPDTANFTYVKVEPPIAGDILLTEIMVDVNPTPVGVPAKQYIELYNKSNKFLNLNGVQFADAVSTSAIAMSYTLAPNAYVIVCKASDTALFTGITNKIGTSTFPTYNTTGDPVYIYDNIGNLLDSIHYSTAWYNDPAKSGGGWSLELINPNANTNCFVQNNWAASTNVNGGTPGVQNSIYSTAPDITAPQFVSATVVDSTTLTLCFNEAISSSLISTLSNYIVNNSVGSPSNATPSSNNTCVTLTFATSFTSQLANTITYSSLADCNGNLVTPNTANFTYVKVESPIVGDIILTEIMVDVNPVPIGVPAKQYVELYNKSNKFLNLNGVQFADAVSTSAIVTSYTLAPNAYVVVCKAADTALFTGITNKIGTSTFPTYNTTGDPVYIYDNIGNLLDSIHYSTAWYNDPAKSGGGWSLELINPNANTNCLVQNNWAASTNANGGTPGVQNSIYSTAPDITAPQFVSATVVDSVTLILCFNEAISSSLISTLSNYTVNNSIGNPSSAMPSSNNTCVTLTFATSFTSQLANTITFSSLADCSGNPVTPNNISFIYIRTENPLAGDLILTEIMVDVNPVPLGVPAKQYIELYNKSNKFLNLNGVQFADAVTTSAIVTSYTLAPNAYVVVCKAADTALFTGITNKIGTSTFPTYNTTGDPVYIYDNIGTLLDSIHYSTAWYNDPTKSSGGWSLELINPNASTNCFAQNNWAASTNANGGTPGIQNSIYSTAPDITAPQFVSATVVDSTTLTLCFNEAISSSLISTLSNYAVNNSIGNPSSATPSSNNTCVTLTFAAAFTSQLANTITFSSLADCSGNLVTPNTAGFTYIRTDNPVMGDVIINELMIDVNPVPAGLPAKQYVELYNKSSKYFNLINWQLSDKVSSVSINQNYILAPSTYVMITKEADTALFVGITNKIGTSSLPSYNTTGDGVYLQDVGGSYIDSVNYTNDWYNNAVKKDGGWSLELINPTLNVNCITQNNWTGTNNMFGGTPGAQNSVYSIAPDVTAPTPLYVSVTSPLNITVCFSEAISSNLVANIAGYTISNSIGNPLSATVSASSNTCVDLALASPLQNQTNYTLAFTGLSDCSGNAVNPASVGFSYYKANPNDVVINEIFADPTPQVGLPDEEYIELYNRSPYAVSLNNWTITVGNHDIIIPNTVIQPDSFVVLIDDASLNTFQNMGYSAYPLVAPTAMTTSELNTSNESIVLKDDVGTIISYVYYSDSWYQDATKKAGGWSLEQIDPNNPCAGQNNWKASANPLGGTPGNVNSINASNPDTQLPQIVKVNVVNKDTIVAVFNESIQYNSMLATASYSIDNGIGNPVSVMPQPLSYTKALLVLANSLQKNTTYSLTITGNITDCAGNIISANTGVRFGLPDTLIAGDVLINEVLFNPKTGGTDYVELYNNSSKILDLKDLYIGEGSATSTLVSDTVRITEEGYILFPGEYVLLSEDGALVKSQYNTINPNWFLDVASLPAMNTTEDVVVITNLVGGEIDKLAYTDKMHFSLLNDVKGVSLERIDFNRPTADKTNWNSASVNVGFGTPAYKNSQYMVTQGLGEFSVVPEIFSPDNDGYNDVVTINYTVNESGLAGNIDIYNSDGQLIRHLARNENLATSGSYSWNGITEQNEKAPIGIYVIYFETFNSNGKVQKHKFSCVLAGKL